MNKEEVYALLCEGRLTIAFDTNALFGDKRFLALCNKFNRIKHFETDYQFKLVIPAPAHAEKLLDLKQKFQQKYDYNEVIIGLKDKRVTVMSFEPHHADIVANLIGKQFPNKKDWYQFKLQRCLDCLGLKLKHYEGAATGKHCSATVDWLIAGYAYAEDCLLITDDTGIAVSTTD
jgi:hypothetical protein